MRRRLLNSKHLRLESFDPYGMDPITLSELMISECFSYGDTENTGNADLRYRPFVEVGMG